MKIPETIYAEYLNMDTTKEVETDDYANLMSMLDNLIYSCSEENNLKYILDTSPINEYLILLYENKDYNLEIKECALRYLTHYHRTYSELPCYQLLLNDLIWLFGRHGIDYKDRLTGLVKSERFKNEIYPT